MAGNADGLIIRTRTICNSALLADTPIRFIATATIGFDHIDTDYCAEQDISWHHAPGCNASSVMQYLASLMALVSRDESLTLAGKRMGIVGVGHVGRKIERLAGTLGMITLRNDPPREQVEGGGGFCSLEEICETCDLITLHVPYNRTGYFPTHHLAGESFFDRLKNRPHLINTSRGGVVDTRAAILAIRTGKISGFYADVFENEPAPDPELLRLSRIATPHIAGYSAEGKANGTAACVRAASRHFGLGIDDWYPQNIPAPANPDITIETTGKSIETVLLECILHTYNVGNDDSPLRQSPHSFEHLRNSYPVRREFTSFTVNLSPSFPTAAEKLQQLGFQLSKH
jgi:erythronate-4-phosphate dehydrogenase